MNYGKPTRLVAEYYERKLAQSADIITTVNEPLAEKVREYNSTVPIFEVPNYPLKSFSENYKVFDGEEAITFVGRISNQEGIKNFLNLAKRYKSEKFRIVGDGPFSKFYLSNLPKNVEWLGYQSHENIPGIIAKAKICIAPMLVNRITYFTTDKSNLKVNEYLNMGKVVYYSSIRIFEKRKNLFLVNNWSDGIDIYKTPEKMDKSDFRFWDSNIVRSVYEEVKL